jgi:hypothetical protein
LKKYACIKGNSYDFKITQISRDVILYEDMSVWMVGDNYYMPETYEVFISQVGGGMKVVVNTKGITRIEGKQVGSAVGFIDGTYCFSTVPCGTTFTRYKLLAWGLECCLSEYVYQLVENRSQDHEYEEYEKIERLIGVARYNAEIGNIEMANNVYAEAKTAIEDLNCNCKCLKHNGV